MLVSEASGGPSGSPTVAFVGFNAHLNETLFTIRSSWWAFWLIAATLAGNYVAWLYSGATAAVTAASWFRAATIRAHIVWLTGEFRESLLRDAQGQFGLEGKG